MRIKLIVTLVLALLFFSACGYKPSSSYAKQEINGTVFVDLEVNIEDPKNSVLIKDALTEQLVYKLGSKLVNKKELADNILKVRLNDVSFSTLQYDKDGYIKLYKATTSINVSYDNKTRKKDFTLSDTYDFSIENGTTISDSKRYEAIKAASTKALNKLISKIAILSFENSK